MYSFYRPLREAFKFLFWKKLGIWTNRLIFTNFPLFWSIFKNLGFRYPPTPCWSELPTFKSIFEGSPNHQGQIDQLNLEPPGRHLPIEVAE